jgi:hypothetical protein
MYVKWKLISVRLEIVLVSAQDRCIVCAKCTTGIETFLTHPMVLQGDVVQVEARFAPFAHSVNLDTRYWLSFAPSVPQAWKPFRAHPMLHIGDVS